MNPDHRKSLITITVATLLGAMMALAGSQHGATVAGVPVFSLAVLAAFVIQWFVFVPSFRAQTERFFDLTGALTYISITVMIVLLTPGVDFRGLLLGGLVMAWAARLGTFLFRRTSKAGKDDRFDDIVPSFVRFLGVWTVQGLWVTITAASAWVAITASNRVPFDWFGLVGFAVWTIGFAIEVVADLQKSRFNADPVNKGRFITTGLWSKSRHPNYFGEILVWIGVAVIALPVLRGWQWVALISPVFVTLLLTKVSGVPLLEAKAERKWGGQPDYEAYRQSTPVLVPRL